jgi:hypothetical protein
VGEEEADEQARGRLLHLDEVRPDLAPETLEYHGIIRLPHPPYSHDPSSTYVWIFGNVKVTLDAFFFQDLNEASDQIVTILRSIPLGTFIRVVDEWKERLTEYI